MSTKPQIQPKVTITIDNREHETFVSNLQKRLDIEKIPLQMTNLAIGDILYQYGEKDFLIIERKTLNDLNQSIKDYRYKEQKYRIMNSDIPFKLYLVEGSLYGAFRDYDNITSKDHPRIYGAMIHTTLRDQIPVLRAENMEDTCKMLSKIYFTIKKYGYSLHEKSRDKSNYIDTLKLSTKKVHMTPDICYLSQLRQIPGVSLNIAKTIQEVYPSLFHLINQYNTISDDQVKCKNLIRDLIIPTSKRKIGPVVSERIYLYLKNL